MLKSHESPYLSNYYPPNLLCAYRVNPCDLRERFTPSVVDSADCNKLGSRLAVRARDRGYVVFLFTDYSGLLEIDS